MPKVSIVVPVYNVEHYLDRCIGSIVNQTHSNLEILLIDDGSPDRCPEMCDEWAEKDPRIRVIHKENAGLGMARNTGLEQAAGKYICFFDGDDYVAHNTIELAVEMAERERADLVLFGADDVDEAGRIACKPAPETQKTCYRGVEVLQELLPSLLRPDMPGAGTKGLMMSACCCLFSMQMIAACSWRFVSEREIISEDVYSLLELYRNVGSAAVVRQNLYYYCQNQSSLSRTYRPDRVVKNRQFYQACMALCERSNYPDIVKKSCAGPFIANTIGAMKQEAAYHPQLGTAIKGVQTIIEDPVLHSAVKQARGAPGNMRRQILLWAMEHKFGGLCYVLIKANVLLKNRSR